MKNSVKQSTIIRPAVIEELPILLAFEQKIIEAERPFDQNLKTDINYYDLHELIESNQSRVLIAEVNGEIVGSGYAKIRTSKVYLDHDRHSYLGFMYVKPEFRGQGIIQKLITELVEWSRVQGLTDVYLEVYADNEKAVRAYTKSGFRQSLLEMKIRI